MGTPERVYSDPGLPVPLPCLSTHQAAMLVRGLDRHLEILGRLRGCMSADGFAERSDPAHAVREKAAAALGEWCAREGRVRVEGGAAGGRLRGDARARPGGGEGPLAVAGAVRATGDARPVLIDTLAEAGVDGD